jgi:hypothetical protein
MTTGFASLAAPASTGSESPSWTRWQVIKNTNSPQKTGSQIRQSRQSFGKSSLRANWEAQCDKSMSRISSIPESIFELYEEKKIEISHHDIEFLLQLSLFGKGSSEISNAAIKLLGILIEEDENWEIQLLHSKAIDILSILLDHPDPSRRYSAIMALWQGKVLQSIHALRMRLRSETNGLVKNTAEQALDVLTRYANTSVA